MHRARLSLAGRGAMSRRDLLTGAAVGLALLWRPRGFSARAAADVKTAPPPPRYWLHIVLTGGPDAIWTADPKTRADVKQGVDVPFEPHAITSAGEISFGPLFAPLAGVADRLAIVNGVLVRTANHYTGIEQAARLRTRTTMRTPAAFDIVGAHRDSQ